MFLVIIEANNGFFLETSNIFESEPLNSSISSNLIIINSSVIKSPKHDSEEVEIISDLTMFLNETVRDLAPPQAGRIRLRFRTSRTLCCCRRNVTLRGHPSWSRPRFATCSDARTRSPMASVYLLLVRFHSDQMYVNGYACFW